MSRLAADDPFGHYACWHQLMQQTFSQGKRVQTSRPAATLPGPDVAARTTTPLVSSSVGRSAEALDVAELLASANGDTAAAIIEGEPGIGKTTLWLSALDRAQGQGLRELAARTSAAESVLAYPALADLLTGIDP